MSNPIHRTRSMVARARQKSKALARSGKLARVLNRETMLRKEIERLNAELVVARQLARVDELCQIFNRRAFNEEYRRTCALALRHGEQYGLLMIDLDRFKVINDTYGHEVGNTVLVAAAHAIKHCVRSTDFVARLGGDEFAVILSRISKEDLEAKANEIANSIRSTAVRHQDQLICVSASVGQSMIGPTYENSAMELADVSMYRQKNASRQTQFTHV